MSDTSKAIPDNKAAVAQNAQRLVFLHIPKAAGSSVRANLGKLFQPDTRFNIYDQGGLVGPAGFPDFQLPNSWRFISGHLAMPILLKNPALSASATDILLLAFVRDPIDRLVSLYNFIISRPNHPQHEKVLKAPPEKFLSNMPANRQCYFLDYPKDIDLRWSLILAPIERVAPVCADISQRVIGKTTPAENFERRLNVTESPREGARVHKSQMSADFIDQLRKKHSRDQALYEAALSKGALTSWSDLP